MNSAINFIELENQVFSATYRNLMIGAVVVLVDATSENRLADPVSKITSPAPNGSLRMRLPASLKPTFRARSMDMASPPRKACRFPLN